MKRFLLLSSLALVGAGLITSCGNSGFDASSNITLYSREAGSGTRECFFEGIGYGDVAKEDKWNAGVSVQSAASNGEIMTKVGTDASAVGYCSLDSLKDGEGIKALTFEGVEATEETAVDGSYKLKRNFNYVVRDSADARYTSNEDLKVAKEAFVAYMTESKEGLQTIAANGGIIDSSRITVASAKSWADIAEEKFPELTSTWSLTAEYAPIKTGGLGVVPVDIQDNFQKLGIDTPTFIPMYLKKNQSEFIEYPQGEYKYAYNGKTFNLKKAAETTTHVFRNGQTKPEKIEYYVTEESIPDSDKKKTLVFVKSRDYFNDNIYDSTTNAEETERFALFTKSVYKLAKLKVNMALTDPNEKNPKTGISNLKICDKDAFDKIKAPNSMVLNDWHAGSMASLLRYRAPMEYNYNEIPKKTFEALKDMPLLMIGHNLSCQGNSNAGSGSLLSKNRVTENIINTLYDSYAIAITEHAHSGITGENDDMCNTVLMKRRTGDKHFNHLFNGVALSDWFVPVSKNYTNEVINDPMKSGILYPLLQRRKNSGTISGIINGLDKNKVEMKAVSHNNFVKDLELAEYDQNTGIDRVMELRTENKGRFYNAFVKPIMDGTLDKPEVVGNNVNISEQDFVDAPVISFAHRLTNQKGLSIMKGAIFRLFDNWDELFPGKKMPFFIVGGPAEAADELQHLYDLKNGDYGKNKERLNHVLALKGNMPNPAIMAASTFFCAPSTYEPCGLTQGECFAKGTPVITTDVGGFHDTIVDGKTGFLAPHVSEESFYNKLVEALKMYYERPEDYKKMVQNDLEIDFSWVQKDKQGPIFEYTDKLGFDRKDLPDIAKAA